MQWKPERRRRSAGSFQTGSEQVSEGAAGRQCPLTTGWNLENYSTPSPVLQHSGYNGMLIEAWQAEGFACRRSAAAATLAVETVPQRQKAAVVVRPAGAATPRLGRRNRLPHLASRNWRISSQGSNNSVNVR